MGGVGTDCCWLRRGGEVLSRTAQSATMPLVRRGGGKDERLRWVALGGWAEVRFAGAGVGVGDEPGEPYMCLLAVRVVCAAGGDVWRGMRAVHEDVADVFRGADAVEVTSEVAYAGGRGRLEAAWAE